MRKQIAIFSFLTVAACAAPALEVRIPPIEAEVNRSVPDEQLSQYVRHFIRSYTLDAVTGEQVEFAGARCSIRSDQIRAQIVTPAVVDIPSFIQRDRFAQRGQPDPLNILCIKDSLSGSAVIYAIGANRVSDRPVTQTPDLFASQISGGRLGSEPWVFPTTFKINLN